MVPVLHDYQKRAVDFVDSHTHACLLLEMGLGKSLITLTAISRLINDVMVCKVLVVAPKKVAESTWTDEVGKWDTLRHLRVSKVMGTERQRIAALNTDADIYVIGRDSFVWLVKYYKAIMPFDMLVIDELTSFKSNTSQRFKAMRLVRGQFNRIVGLTGTPAPNGYMDLWAEMYCIDGGEALGKFITHYRRDYFNVRTGPQGYILSASLKPGAKESIDRLISPMCISMQAKDYLSLPERRDIIRHVCLPESVMKKYRKFEHDMVMEIKDNERITASNAAALLGKLMQFANGAVYTEEHDYEEMHGEKVEALLEIVEEAKSPVLVFYQYKHDTERIRKAMGKDCKVVEYKSEEDLRAWNEGKIDVLLAHPSSCAYGLNMQYGGHIIVWFGVGYNLELYEQACARLYRQGQKMSVQIYHLICPGTADEKAMAALRSKSSTQEAIMRDLKDIIDRCR